MWKGGAFPIWYGQWAVGMFARCREIIVNIVVHNGRIAIDSLSFRQILARSSDSAFRILKTPDSTPSSPSSSDESVVDINSNDLTCAAELSWRVN